LIGDRSRQWRIAVVAVLLIVAFVLHVVARRAERAAAARFAHQAVIPYSASAARFLSADPALRRAIDSVAAEERFRRGQTVSDVLDELGLEPVERHALAEALAEHADLRKLRPEDSYAALLDDGDAELREFRLTLAGRGQVAVRRQDGGWTGAWRPFTRSSRLRRVAGELRGSLEGSIQSAGGSPRVAYEMAEVLQWDLDFNRDLRLGDRFEVVYEEVFLDGAFESAGEILALRYDNAGRLHEAYRFGEPPGYYDGEGRPLRKLFLRSPLRYSRVTSRFSKRRFHPVLKRYRPHHGVDYGAPVGTPVRVTGNGTVVFVGWDGGGGRTVKVRHPNGFLTAYLHLSRFAAGIRRGRRVGQGDTIGYVGATGLASGPHLDYRVQKNGRWINPLAMTVEPAPPIPEDRLAAFVVRRDELRQALSDGVLEAPPSAETRLAVLRGRTAAAVPAGGS
jgi:murein DD-endopeptidase MepM/ murein hydrolase activator NlpD